MVFVAKCLILLKISSSVFPCLPTDFLGKFYLPRKRSQAITVDHVGNLAMQAYTNIFLSTCYQRFDTKLGTSVAYILCEEKKKERARKIVGICPILFTSCQKQLKRFFRCNIKRGFQHFKNAFLEACFELV